MLCRRAVVVVITTASASAAIADTLVTVAGGYAYAEDYGSIGAATVAHLNRALGLTVDGSGNVYIADTGNNVIRKVNVGGTLTTVVGQYSSGCNCGVAGSTSDPNNVPTNSQLNGPVSVAVTSNGAIMYIADKNNFAVRAVGLTPFGVISTVIGQLGVQASEGWSGHYFKPERATTATLVGPIALCFSPDETTVYFTNNYAIYGWNTSHLSLYAGGWSGGDSCNGASQTSCAATDARFAQTPSAIWMDTSWNMYVADYGMQTIRKVGADGMVSVFR